jgi:hypothetical protein
MSNPFSKEFNIGEITFADSTQLVFLRSVLCPYFKGGLPDGFLAMDESAINQWFDDNELEVIPNLKRDDLKSFDKIGLILAINCYVHEQETIAVKYCDHDAIISFDGMAHFVFSLLECKIQGDTLLVD